METTVNRDVELLRIYSKDKLFEPCEREETRFWDDLKEADEESPGGKGRFFRIIGASGWSVGNPAEAGDYPQHRIRRQAECSVQPAQMASTIEVSSKFLAASQGDGSYSGDAEHDAIMEATRNLFAYADILLGCGHGTGRLAVIAANAAATDTITLDEPELTYQLRDWMTIDIVDQDTGGTPQYTDVQILEIDADAKTLTLDQNVTVTAGWGIYIAGVYGNAMPNGLRNIVDDGDFASTIFNASRSTYPFLNAYVNDGGGGLQDYSEELVRKVLMRLTGRQKLIPTQLRCNEGIVNEHLRLTTADRVYNVTGSEVPKYNVGANQETLHFQYADKKIPFRVDRNLPARELYALHMPSFRKHTLVPAGWFKDDDGSILSKKPSDGGGTYAYAFIGSQIMDMTISTRKLNANAKISNIRDRDGAGDA